LQSDALLFAERCLAICRAMPCYFSDFYLAESCAAILVQRSPAGYFSAYAAQISC